MKTSLLSVAPSGFLLEQDLGSVVHGQVAAPALVAVGEHGVTGVDVHHAVDGAVGLRLVRALALRPVGAEGGLVPGQLPSACNIGMEREGHTLEITTIFNYIYLVKLEVCIYMPSQNKLK